MFVLYNKWNTRFASLCEYCIESYVTNKFYEVSNVQLQGLSEGNISSFLVEFSACVLPLYTRMIVPHIYKRDRIFMEN